jgi:hypothetical protein
MRGAHRGIRNVGQVIKRIPAVRALRERRYEDLLVSDEAYGYFRGVFDPFEEAVQSSRV